MRFYDYHCHTTFSPDAKGTMEQMVRSAIDKNLAELCFTDHLDIDYPESNIQFDLDYKGYHEEYTRLNNQYGNSISLKLGLELGLQPHVLKECEEFVTKHKFDFVIGSVHGAQKMDLYSGSFMEGKDKTTSYRQYLEEVYTCVKEFDLFNVVGHLDLIRRYGTFEENSMEYIDYREIVDEIFNVLIPKGKGIEVNTSGYRYGLGGPHPTFEYIRMYKQHGGEIITVGSDSHNPSTLGIDFELVYDMLRQVGFKYITTFKDMKPQFIKI